MTEQEEVERKINSKLGWGGLAIIVSLIANLCAGSWFASDLNGRVANLEDISKQWSSDRELLVRMDERTSRMADDIIELKKQVGK